MPYRVAARPLRAGHWILTGPIFDNFDAARQYMATLREPVKRMVRTYDGAPHESPGLLPSLDRRRLEYVRYLVETKRIQEW